MADENAPDETALRLITQFSNFLEEFGKATDQQQRTFLEFLTPQTRSDLIHLAAALVKEKGKQ